MSDGIVLALDAATYEGSVAILHGRRVLVAAEAAMRGATEERLLPAVVSALSRAGIGLAEVTAIACGAGPGSFTSLRIAAALAKGLAVSRGLPLVAASSLALLLAGDDSLGPGDYLAQLDAMRGDVYAQEIRKLAGGGIEVLTHHALMNAPDAAAMAAERGLTTIGNAGQAPARVPHARGFAALLGNVARPVSLADWEPDYGRLAEAQVQWERRHGRSLAAP